jgi:hypothetical protein
MFLKETVEDILKNIEANTDIIVVLDGEPAIKPLEPNDRITVLELPSSVGQREALDMACRLSDAKYVMKIDAHCSFDKGFDRKMLDAFEIVGDNVTMVPTMRNLHVFDWVCYHNYCGWKSYQGPTPTVCPNCGRSDKLRRRMVWVGKERPQSNSFCFDSEPHFQYFNEYTKRSGYKEIVNKTGVTETMSLQGSCFMCTREKYWELDLGGAHFGNWGNQGLQVACATWLSGGKVLVNHKTWYSHMFRTQGGDFGFPYPLSGRETKETKNKVKEYFWNMRHPKQIYPVSWLVEKFYPVPGWSDEDLEELKYREEQLKKV